MFLLTELWETLFLIAISFSLILFIKSNLIDSLVLLEILQNLSTKGEVAIKVWLQCLHLNLCLSNKMIAL